MTETPAHHTAAHWANRRRALEEFIVERVDDNGDSTILTDPRGSTLSLPKAALGREIHVGERLLQETAGFSQVTGLRDAEGWLFHYTNQELADEARRFSDDMRRNDVVRLEKNRKMYAQWENDLPDWLQARIRRFRDAGGEHLLVTGWHYELIICRLAALLGADDEAGAAKLARDLEASDNQWGWAKALADGRKRNGDDYAVLLPAAVAQITGSADYFA